LLLNIANGLVKVLPRLFEEQRSRCRSDPVLLYQMQTLEAVGSHCGYLPLVKRLRHGTLLRGVACHGGVEHGLRRLPRQITQLGDRIGRALPTRLFKVLQGL
jgi:hypothetical protein